MAKKKSKKNTFETKKFFEISKEEVENAFSWFSTAKADLPECVQKIFLNFDVFFEFADKNQSKYKDLLIKFRKALGIIPSSERDRNRRVEKTKEDNRASLVEDKDYHDGRATWHKNQHLKHKTMSQSLEKKIKSVDDVILSEEAKADIERENQLEKEILTASGAADPSLSGPNEVIMTGLGNQLIVEEVTASLPEDMDLKNIFLQKHRRYDLRIDLARLDIHVEKGQDDLGTLHSASTFHLGPKNYQVTWETIVTIAILVTQYALPFERIARLMTTDEKKFSSSHVYRYFRYAAQGLLPIYLKLIKQISKSDLISGDDTTIRVIEAINGINENEKTWLHYATSELAEKTLEKNPDTKELGPRIASELGFEFDKKNGTGPKKQLKTTVIVGKTELDPASHIVFYRSHFGNFGNLLDLILMQRSKKQKKVLIQSDLSTVNLVSDPVLLENFEFEFFGCASHARRAFAQYAEDNQICAFILSAFRNIYHQEKGLDLYKRNEKKVLDIRQKISINYWNSILESSHQLCEYYSPSTIIGEAARYMIKNYPKLTAYINNPKVPLTNDLCERMLRMEKLIQAGSLFRTSLEGRFALDICRTIVQTALAAGVDIKKYLTYALKHKENALTPYEYLRLTKLQI